jgi:hypothetical protein
MRKAEWPIGTQLWQLQRWDDFESKLAEGLRHLKERDERFIIVTCTTNGRFIQFLSQDGGSIVGEAISNNQLGDALELTVATCQRLCQLGWHEPAMNVSTGEFFSLRWEPPAPISRVAALAVKSLRDALGVLSPAELKIRLDSFESCEFTGSSGIGRRIPPEADPALQLRSGLVVRNAFSGREYRVGKRLGVGGFGAVYQVTQIAGPELPGMCVLKVSADTKGWHQEAYFGELLKDASGVVRVHESFACVPRARTPTPVYCLVSELVEGGDLEGYMRAHPEPWSEAGARREIIRLLRAVTLLHSSGAVHRDITPRNVFVTSDRMLKLGDFGIARHRVGKRDVPAEAFNVWFAPTAMIHGQGSSWRPADDVYHIGQLYAGLLCGGAKWKFTAAEVKALCCSPKAKAVIQRCIGQRMKRFVSATELLAGLEKQESEVPKQSHVRCLRGKTVVFTGRLGIRRSVARGLLVKAGGIAEDKVTHLTDIVVVGDQSPHWKAESKGQKLLDVDHEREFGHHVILVTERRFLVLASLRRTIPIKRKQ